MSMHEAVSKHRSRHREAPKGPGPKASPEQKEASGISQGKRSDKEPLVRKQPKGMSGLPIWRVDGK
jgi:hypothetical protein